MNTLRRISQVLFLLAFVYLLLATAPKSPSPVPSHMFFNFDPLVWLTTWIASRTLYDHMLLSLVTVIVTVVLGRVFCGWFCPMGTLIDLSDRILHRLKHRLPRRSRVEPKGVRWLTDRLVGLKYVILIGVFVAAAFGTQAAYLFDPFAILYRSLLMLFYPAIHVGARFVSEHVSGFTGFGLIDVTTDRVYYQGHMVSFVLFVAILALGVYGRRYWCRNLCPLGGGLALLSRYPILRRKVTETCTSCSRCRSLCKMAAIGGEYHQTLMPECIQCYACVPVCPPKATSIRFRVSKSGCVYEPDITRRRILQGVGLGAAFLVASKAGSAAKQSVRGLPVASDVLIRPPGALREELFSDVCTRCGECIKVCPTNGIQAAIAEAGFDGFMSPVLIPRVGHCMVVCKACGEVCPTGAIPPFEVIEKKWLYIGLANIDRSKCIAWYKNAACTICDEHCSYDAIYQQEVDGDTKPFVNDEVCIGCGECERVCPIQPVAAIRVYSHGDRRSKSRSQQLSDRRAAPLCADQMTDSEVEAASYRTVDGKEVFVPPEEPKY
jgi:ferredoxin-type protein NapF